ncbi:hypothetical protein KFL_002480090 [Klebsormidium nitens]|uniref:Uncharacterized protein n=1 Tax=Klebsormidium nitens TaxID=105231 RepID=A0A1Y1I962_KLENI|nr:hypothetical protein KFL_002480090 [Klebsormidium nitens]|eukprot:GAQ85671.1 hypothetical protein KFL_002480090 [Klebsormidium nitens]
MESSTPVPVSQMAFGEAAAMDEQADVINGRDQGLPPLSKLLKVATCKELDAFVARIFFLKKAEGGGVRTTGLVPAWFPNIDNRTEKYVHRAQKLKKHELLLVLEAALTSYRNEPQGREALKALQYGITEYFKEPKCHLRLFLQRILTNYLISLTGVPVGQPDGGGSPLVRSPPPTSAQNSRLAGLSQEVGEPGAGAAASGFAEDVHREDVVAKRKRVEPETRTTAPNGSLDQEGASPAFASSLMTSPVTLGPVVDPSLPPGLETDSTSLEEDFEGQSDWLPIPEPPPAERLQPYIRTKSTFPELMQVVEAEQGAPQDHFELGMYYLIPMRGAPYDEKKAFMWFNIAAASVGLNEGSPQAWALLAWCYFYAVGVAEDREGGVMCARRVPWDPVAMFILGVAYAEGSGGVERDLEESNKWLKAATEGLQQSSAFNDPFTQQLLGLCCLNGHGGTDRSVGLHWIRKAAIRGYLSACNVLGNRLRGAGQVREAFEWTFKAAEGGYASAQLALAKDFLHGSDAEAYFKLAAEKGLSDAQFELGVKYVEVEKDLDKGLKWLRRAAAQKHRKAEAYLAEIENEEIRKGTLVVSRKVLLGAGSCCGALSNLSIAENQSLTEVGS